MWTGRMCRVAGPSRSQRSLHPRQPATASDAILQDGAPGDSVTVGDCEAKARSTFSCTKALQDQMPAMVVACGCSRHELGCHLSSGLHCEARVDEFAKYVNMVRDMDPQCKEDSSARVCERRFLALRVLAAGELPGISTLPRMLVRVAAAGMLL